MDYHTRLMDDPYGHTCCGCQEEEAYNAGRVEGFYEAGADDVALEPAVKPHRHVCDVCHDYWWHDVGDEGCVGVETRTCPIHKDGDDD